jgi:hypothetical protein
MQSVTQAPGLKCYLGPRPLIVFVLDGLDATDWLPKGHVLALGFLLLEANFPTSV